MDKIYRGPGFALTARALDAVGQVRMAYLEEFPDDPPEIAGIAMGQPLTDELSQPLHVVIGFWRKSELSDVARRELNTGKIGDFEIALFAAQHHQHYFAENLIDHSPERAFFLRPA
ncbi:MAG: hypothetical protein KDJ19_06285 [Hyphomicrobiaceae bacterium]|nr:hypothetical protein [Hyphomicrobiaceae bacterium]